MAFAKSTSSSVRPPAEWVESLKVTLFHDMAMSG